MAAASHASPAPPPALFSPYFLKVGLDGAIAKAIARMRLDVASGALSASAKNTAVPTFDEVRFCLKRRKVTTEDIYAIITKTDWPEYHGQRVAAHEAAKARRRAARAAPQAAAAASLLDPAYDYLALDPEYNCCKCSASLQGPDLCLCGRVCTHYLCPACLTSAVATGPIVQCPGCCGSAPPSAAADLYGHAIPAAARGLIDPEFIVYRLGASSEKVMALLNAGRHVPLFFPPVLSLADPATHCCEHCACLALAVGGGMTRCAGCAFLACGLCRQSPHPGTSCLFPVNTTKI